MSVVVNMQLPQNLMASEIVAIKLSEIDSMNLFQIDGIKLSVVL